jgi:hypothetical protein
MAWICKRNGQLKSITVEIHRKEADGTTLNKMVSGRY